ncbi:MAG: hypothetical protein HWD59_07260 [Coxiellaceae bacterium]|nr:MAG: hypothetical protein HWD59_07260 [Coxiellaceae bacterium]
MDDMVTWLCQHNAKLETTDANGETALQVASKKQMPKLWQYYVYTALILKSQIMKNERLL